MSVSVDIQGLDSARLFFDTFPGLSAKAASLALNTVASKSGMALAADTIMQQIAFPKDYLKGDRLAVSQYSTPGNLVAAIKARKRATSLARFATSGSINVPGVTVSVKKGQSIYLKRAFLVRLRRGASLDEDNYNVGLAVRIKAGERIVDKNTQHKSFLEGDAQSGGLALLYGPSVDQVFREVADRIEPGILDLLAAEFFRQFDRLA